MRAETASAESTSDQAIAAAVKRNNALKASMAAAAKRKKTASNKQTHAVNNEMVHELNDSSSQADARQDIDRDSEQTESWSRPHKLDAPDPRPGYVQRLVRLDNDNLDRRIQEGWIPRKRASAKQGHELTSDRNSKYSLYYVMSGMILCEMPEEKARQRNDFYRKKQLRMTESIDRDLFKLSNPLMPMLKPSRKTRVTTTARRGRLDDQIAGDDED